MTNNDLEKINGDSFFMLSFRDQEKTVGNIIHIQALLLTLYNHKTHQQSFDQNHLSEYKSVKYSDVPQKYNSYEMRGYWLCINPTSWQSTFQVFSN